MAKKQKMQKALALSIVAMILCVAMLAGTTFAWFTDSAASGSNVITAGNLDVEVQYTLGDKNDEGEMVWNDLDGATDLFRKGLWEPGHTEVVALRIKNNGTLALKYVANMNIVSENIGKTKDGADIVLSEILTVSTLIHQAIDENGNANQIGDITLGLAFNGENSVRYEQTSTFKAGNVLRSEVQLLPGAAHYMIVKVDMAESVGNEANHNGTDIPTINFGINVLTTQFAYENDSFGTDYDEDAPYRNTRKVTAESEKQQITNEDAEKYLKALAEGDNLIVDEKVDILAFDTNEVNAWGATVTLAGQGSAAYGYLAFLPDAGEDVAVSNLNVTGAGFVEVGHYKQGGGNYVLNNVKIENLVATLKSGDMGRNVGCAFSGYGTTTLNNCVMTGTTAVQNDTIPFDLGCTNSTITNINGGKYDKIYCWSHSTVNVDDAEVGTMHVAPIWGKVTIAAGTHVDIIYVDYGIYENYATADNLAKLVIEEGAEVDAIQFDSKTYTLAEWNARG